MLYKTLEDPALVQAFSHPLRAKMLGMLQEGEASPKELAAHFNLPLSNVAYHIQVLRKLKLIRLVKKTPRRGAVEHHYRADRSALIDKNAWAQTSDLVKDRMVASTLDEVGGYATQAAATGGFNRANAHLTRSRVVLDQAAWDVLADKLDDVLELIDDLEKQSATRLKRANHEGEIRTGVVMMQFEATPEIRGADDARAPKPATGRTARPRSRARAAVA